MNKKQLHAEAKARGLKGYSRMPLAALKEMLAAAERKGIQIQKDREERNGVKRRSTGGICDKIWSYLDGLKSDTFTPSAKNIRSFAADNNLNLNNALMEFYSWRKFNGITGRQ